MSRSTSSRSRFPSNLVSTLVSSRSRFPSNLVSALVHTRPLVSALHPHRPHALSPTRAFAAARSSTRAAGSPPPTTPRRRPRLRRARVSSTSPTLRPRTPRWTRAIPWSRLRPRPVHAHDPLPASGSFRPWPGGGDATAPVRAVAVVAAAAPHAEPNEKMYDGGAGDETPSRRPRRARASARAKCRSRYRGGTWRSATTARSRRNPSETEPAPEPDASAEARRAAAAAEARRRVASACTAGPDDATSAAPPVSSRNAKASGLFAFGVGVVSSGFARGGTLALFGRPRPRFGGGSVAATGSSSEEDARGLRGRNQKSGADVLRRNSTASGSTASRVPPRLRPSRAAPPLIFSDDRGRVSPEGPPRRLRRRARAFRRRRQPPPSTPTLSRPSTRSFHVLRRRPFHVLRPFLRRLLGLGGRGRFLRPREYVGEIVDGVVRKRRRPGGSGGRAGGGAGGGGTPRPPGRRILSTRSEILPTTPRRESRRSRRSRRPASAAARGKSRPPRVPPPGFLRRGRRPHLRGRRPPSVASAPPPWASAPPPRPPPHLDRSRGRLPPCLAYSSHLATSTRAALAPFSATNPSTASTMSASRASSVRIDAPLSARRRLIVSPLGPMTRPI